MRYRYLRQRSTGQWCNVTYSTTADVFDTPASDHLASAVEAFELPVADLEIVESESPQDVSRGRQPKPVPPDPLLATVAALRNWATDPANPPPSRPVVLGILRVLRAMGREELA